MAVKLPYKISTCEQMIERVLGSSPTGHGYWFQLSGQHLVEGCWQAQCTCLGALDTTYWWYDIVPSDGTTSCLQQSLVWEWRRRLVCLISMALAVRLNFMWRWRPPPYDGKCRFKTTRFPHAELKNSNSMHIGKRVYSSTGSIAQQGL